MAFTLSSRKIADFLKASDQVTDTSQAVNPSALIRIGFLTNSSGTRHLCSYDPVTDTIFFEDQVGQVAPVTYHA